MTQAAVVKVNDTVIQYPGPYRPFAHQRTTTEFIVEHPRCYVLNDMGTGKTASVIWAINHLFAIGEVQRVLIVAPLSTLFVVWQRELMRLVPQYHVKVFTKSQRGKYDVLHTPWQIGVVNYDGLKSMHRLYPSLASSVDMFVVDEASHLRNRTTQRWKVAYAFAKVAKRVVLMTGTPCPNAPTDVYALALLVDEARTRQKYRSFTVFRYVTMVQTSRFRWEALPDGYAKAFDLMQPAIRFAKDSCLDLPPLVYEDRHALATAEQRQALREVKQHYRLIFDDITKVNVVNAADCINKMRQIALGVLKVDEDQYRALNYEHRLAALREIIEEAPHKVVVVVPFKGAIQDLTAKLKCPMINGDIKVEERTRIIEQFNRPGGAKVLLIHPKVAAHGISLVAASTLVFYGPIFSVEEVRQVVDRINRPGQVNSMTVIRLYSEPFELKIYDKVERKQVSEAMFLELFEQEVLQS